MVLSNIYIARHGFRSNWLPEPHPKPVTGIDSDPPLAEHGEDQAKELAHYMFSIEPQPEIIFTSPFYRCLQTAQPIANVLEIKIRLENGIGEWYKPDRPSIPKPGDFNLLSKYFSDLEDNWESTLYPSSKGETEIDIFNRCQEFLEKFIPKFEMKYPEVDTILFVTHAATKIALGMALLGFSNVREPIDDEDTRLRAGACSLDLYQRDENLNKWNIKMNGNVEFLTEGEEMHWDFANGFEAGSDEDLKNRSLKKQETNEEYTDVFVTLDIPKTNFNSSQIPPTAKLQISGLHTQHPLFKVDNDIYQGDWQKLVGTEVAITDDLGDKYKITDRIVLEDVTPQ